MAAVTPRKRKHRSGDGRGSTFGTPVKRLIVDCSVVLTPLQPRSLNKSNVKKHRSTPAYTAMENPKEKENFSTSPVIKSGVVRKLVVSPPQEEQIGEDDIYMFSPVKALSSVMSAKSFYKKDTMYMSPVDRKLVKESKSKNGPVASLVNAKSSVANALKVTRTNAALNKKRAASRRSVPSSKAQKKVKINEPSTTPPASVDVEGHLLNPQRSAILGLKMKPRPKLTVGAAFFATSKRLHSAPKKLSPHIKFPASSKSKPLKQSSAQDELSSQAVTSGEKAVENHLAKVPHSVEKKDDMKTHGKTKNHPIKVLAQPRATSPDGSAGCDSGLQQPQSEAHVVFDLDEPILNSSDKKVSSMYPIFSTPSVGKKRPFDMQTDMVSPVCSSTSLGTPPLLNKVQKHNKKRDSGKEDDQLIIDAGQKHFGPITCSSCGMIYSAAVLEDNTQHVQYHQRLLESIRYVGWKKERVVAEYWNGKILMICPDDPKYALKKAEEVRELVDTELGFQQTNLHSPSRTKTYLFVTNDKRIVGCLIAESIKQAFRVIPEPVTATHCRDQDALERHRAWRCSSEPTSAICGVSRIWVFALMRRKGIAGHLVDAMRNSFIYGSHLSTDEIAFSDPTPDGKLFASTYCKIPDFLVYNFLS